MSSKHREEWWARFYGAPNRASLVFLHGAGSDHTIWNPVVAQLRRRIPQWTCVGVDLPGHGRNRNPALPSIPALAQALHAWVTVVTRPPRVLVGHSMGGAVAIETALRFPEAWVGFVLVATGGRLRVHPDLLGALDTGRKRDAIAWLMTWLFGPGANETVRQKTRAKLERISLETLQRDFHACNAFDRLNDLEAITAPTLVMGGAEDRMTPPKYSRFLADRLPYGYLVLLPGVGHMLMLEAPDRVAEAIWKWLHSIR